MTTSKKKMTAGQLERKIRIGLRRHGLVLASGCGYVMQATGRCCAIGGALAYKAKTPRELQKITDEIHNICRSSGTVIDDQVFARESARILNHGLRREDMLALETGFENRLWGGSKRNAFYLLGKKLRLESNQA